MISGLSLPLLPVMVLPPHLSSHGTPPPHISALREDFLKFPAELPPELRGLKPYKTYGKLMISGLSLPLLPVSSSHIVCAKSQSERRIGQYRSPPCRDPGSNRGPPDLQSDALPTELSRRIRTASSEGVKLLRGPNLPLEYQAKVADTL